MTESERYRAPRKIREAFSQAWEWTKDLLFPRRCVVCDEPTDDRTAGICHACREKLRYVEEPFCLRCGRQLKESGEEYCSDCSRRGHLFLQNMTLYDYGSVADALFRFKYGGRQEYADVFGRELYERFGGFLSMIQPDALLPVPCHASRLRKRGYNQAQLIAQALSKASHIPVRNDLVIRVKKTQPQKDLTALERQNNLKKAFKIHQNDVKLNTIVIIDDIYTTGSTMDALTEVLLQAGVKRVYGMTLASGRGV